MKSITTCLLVSLLSIATAANAADREKYHLVNNTEFSVTSKLNNGVCSRFSLGEKDGVITKHNDKYITQYQAGAACVGMPKNCQADIYISEDCSGEKIASVTIDVTTGVKPDTIVIHNSAYSLIAHGFYIQLDGGPAAQ